ncbi:transcription antitermination factor NusB [Dysgonomonas massiliensis]|uniref:transcription antitermination factor NusB n=1 Tax=Dysgonomonas massiliensis TaxID=2040292 RepID=UPI000C784FDC|nr:transcription antitermination factor NusB [Dysgonomonas massiliensis]
MINRVLIRIRVMQIVFAYYDNETKDLRKAESELLFSLQKSYDLYHYLLSLMIEVTDLHKTRLDNRKSKLLPSQQDINPDTRLVNNKFIAQLRANKALTEYMNDKPYSWSENDGYIKALLDDILSSDIYKEYLQLETCDYDNDREFWRSVFKNLIAQSEDLYDWLEDESLYWNDDVEIVASFVIKTIKRFDESKGADQELLPMFKDNSDQQFALKLLRETLFNSGEYLEMIGKYTKNWESERIANMDMVIMQIAIAEVLNFASIPTNVTLNEYINIAKAYSTAKSASFINGILDAIIKDLKANNKIVKQ